MIHTMHFTGLGHSHDEALKVAETMANRTFPAIALLSGQRISRLSPLLLPDLAPTIKQACLVYALDVPAGGGEVLDARRAEVEEEMRAALSAPVSGQGYFSFRAAVCMSSKKKASLQLGAYTVTAAELITVYSVTVQLHGARPHLTEPLKTLDTCETFLKEQGIPLEGWVPGEMEESPDDEEAGSASG